MAQSQEVSALIAYFQSTGVAGIVTATSGGKHASTSYHFRAGTGGTGLAMDLGFKVPQRDSPGLLAQFNSFRGVEHKLAELFYSGASYFVKNGQRFPISQLNASVRAAHHNHVHVAVPRGTFLAPLTKPAPPAPKENSVINDPIAAVPCTSNPAGKDAGGWWILGRDGGIANLGGAPFFGSYPALPASARQGQRFFIDIAELKDRPGYRIFGNDGSYYTFDAAAWAAIQKGA